MTIIYSLIARGKDCVLIEFMTASGNFPQITRNLLKKVQRNAKCSFMYDSDYYFHYINEDDFTYLCLTEANFTKRLAFAFLDDIKEVFSNKYNYEQKMNAIAFTFNNSFNPIMKEKIEFYNYNPEADKMKKLKSNINEVKDIMVENIDKILERGEKIELLVTKTKTMSNLSDTFKKKAVQVRRDAQWKNRKLIIIIVLVVLIVLYIILTIACGGFDWKNCV